MHPAVAVEMLYTMCKACADRQPCTASDSAMLWVDLSKSFMTFSRAVGQLLEKSRGVHAEVRKAVWSLYSRPHGSFDPLTGLSAAAPTLGAYLAPCRRSNPQPLFPFACVSCCHALASHILYFSPKGTQSPPGARNYLDCHASRLSEGTITCQGAVAASHAARC